MSVLDIYNAQISQQTYIYIPYILERLCLHILYSKHGGFLNIQYFDFHILNIIDVYIYTSMYVYVRTYTYIGL